MAARVGVEPARRLWSSTVARAKMPTGEVNLHLLFDELNEAHFGDELRLPELRWNTRLRSSAGRFVPGRRSLFWPSHPKIEIATYLLDLEDGLAHIRATLAHEMIHFWLWARRRPYGHSAEFYAKMREIGAIRYNPVPVLRKPKWRYRCGGCGSEFGAKRKLGRVACRKCCDAEADGAFDRRFLLVAEPWSEKND